MTETQKAIIQRAIAHITVSAKSNERIAASEERFNKRICRLFQEDAARDRQLIEDLESLISQ